jgi:hypothetical protein
LRLSYSFTPKIQLQALEQYDELDERSPGAPPTGREYILKYSHIFDVFR